MNSKTDPTQETCTRTDDEPGTEGAGDPWSKVVNAAYAAGHRDYPGRGRVLSVKFGYNPNSSSVGSVVQVAMWSSIFAGVALNVVAALVARDAKQLVTSPKPSAGGAADAAETTHRSTLQNTPAQDQATEARSDATRAPTVPPGTQK